MVTEKVKVVAHESCKLVLDRPVLVGFSGGADSLCLLHCLQLAGYPVVAAHLDHGLRPGSGQDAFQAGKLARDLGVPFITECRPVKPTAESRGLSIEAAARDVRYRFLFEQAGKINAQAVAVGHTADDQVETILLHLLRGTGLQGLHGMAYRSIIHNWGNGLPLVRPLLDTWRAETQAYCKTLILNPVEDPSNQERDYMRNRVRMELIPFLSSFNPQVSQAIWRLGVAAWIDYAYIEEEIKRVWPACLSAEGDGYLALDWQALNRLHPALLAGVLRRALVHLRPGGEAAESADIRRVQAFLQSSPRSGQADLSAGLRLVRVDDRQAGIPRQLVIASWGDPLPGLDGPQARSSSQVLPMPGRVDLGHGWMLTAEVVLDFPQAGAVPGEKPDPFQAWLDVGDAVELVIRSRKEGDRFYPLGLAGHSQKLSDFMVNVRLPAGLRQYWPLVCREGMIAWIPGYRIAHPFRLVESTRGAVHLCLFRISEEE